MSDNTPKLPKEVIDRVFDGQDGSKDATSTHDIVHAVFSGAQQMTDRPAPMDTPNVQPLYGCPVQPPRMSPRPDIVWEPPTPSIPYGGNPIYTIPQWAQPMKPICGSLNNGNNPHVRITGAEFVVDQWRLGALYRIMSPKTQCKAFLIKKAYDKLTFSTVDENGVTKEIEITADELCKDLHQVDIGSMTDRFGATYIFPEF